MTAKRAKKKSVKPPAKKDSAALRQSTALAPAGDFAALVERVVAIIEEARSRVVRTFNSEMVLSYWHIGREIVEYVQCGKARAEYGEQVIEDLSQQLQSRVGRGYSSTNLRYFRTFYIAYRERRPEIRHIGSGESESAPAEGSPRKIRHKRGGVSHEALAPAPLGWSHYRALSRIGKSWVSPKPTFCGRWKSERWSDFSCKLTALARTPIEDIPNSWRRRRRSDRVHSGSGRQRRYRVRARVLRATRSAPTRALRAFATRARVTGWPTTCHRRLHPTAASAAAARGRGAQST